MFFNITCNLLYINSMISQYKIKIECIVFILPLDTYDQRIVMLWKLKDEITYYVCSLSFIDE